MPRNRKKTWRRTEKNFIIENYAEMTTDELCEYLGRDRKSVNRMIEKLRDEGKIGYRNQKTIDRAYKQRNRESNKRSKRRRKKIEYVDDSEEI